ncbi:unnamed protein product [Rotaria sp. Silwood2]|nr:unnamed protein product [Rotaria sp. Silwood2]CAF4759191.1 unnamed protein product [Rotaria sp. Silwood2]
MYTTITPSPAKKRKQNSLSDVALHWHHTKRRNYLNQFTIEVIARIHKFYRNGSSHADEVMDTDSLEEMLDSVDESKQNAGVIDGSSYSLGNTADFIQCVSDNHNILRTKYEAENINEEQSFDDEDSLEVDYMLNTNDRGFQEILIDLDFIEEIQLITTEDNDHPKTQKMTKSQTKIMTYKNY